MTRSTIQRLSQCLVVFAPLACVRLVQAQSPQVETGEITTFSAPDAGIGLFQGTTPLGINEHGAIVGYYIDAQGVNHGFLRDKQGAVTSVDVPGASSTRASSINAKGTIAGGYSDANGAHGFVRDKHGDFTSFDAPGSTLTFPARINDDGAVTGDFIPPGRGARGFVRDKHGVVTPFDAVPTASFTIPLGINEDGAITGLYGDATFPFQHCFVRDEDGTVTSFDTPATSFNTAATSINAEGTVVGTYFDNFFTAHGFVRDKHGAITTLDVPGAGIGNLAGTFVNLINDDGTIVGSYGSRGPTPRHGFVRDKHGAITTFDVPGAYSGTFPTGINEEGDITGIYDVTGFVNHGFVLKQ
jgi:uncharacterized membrane protein